MSPGKMAELNEMPFGFWAWVSPRNNILDEDSDPRVKRQFCGGKRPPIVKYMDCAVSCA